jgi:hypothetical protein
MCNCITGMCSMILTCTERNLLPCIAIVCVFAYMDMYIDAIWSTLSAGILHTTKTRRRMCGEFHLFP